MENMTTKITSSYNNALDIKVVDGHFATNHSHINRYIDMTTIKSRRKMALAAISAGDVVDYCMPKGLYIRSCADIGGLDNKYIRFCFMNPKQDDLLVNTVLEIV